MIPQTYVQIQLLRLQLATIEKIVTELEKTCLGGLLANTALSLEVPPAPVTIGGGVRAAESAPVVPPEVADYDSWGQKDQPFTETIALGDPPGLLEAMYGPSRTPPTPEATSLAGTDNNS